MRLVWALAAMLLPTVILAETVKTSPRPMPRPVVQSAIAAPAPPAVIRPKPRPELSSVAPVPAPVEPAPSKKSAKGSVCGSRAIRGEKLASVKSSVKGCGIKAAVRITEVAGVRLNPAATVNCDTATALETWITDAMRPAFAPRKVVQLHVAASYACRGRNNVKGARISEHGRGNAIDIGAFTFADGKTLAVLGGFNKQMRKAHKGACGIFGTTLGPGSDGYHENHLHFDVARYRSGSYCR